MKSPGEPTRGAILEAKVIQWPRFIPIIGLVFVLACGSASTPIASPATDTPSSPEQDTTSVPVPPNTVAPTSNPLSSSNGEITPISEEQLTEELKGARFSIAGWETNFRLRSIPYEEIRGGGPGKDDIPSIDNPKFESVEQADQWLEDREPVQVANINGDARAYPLQIMIWHEIVNDVVGGEPVVITY